MPARKSSVARPDEANPTYLDEAALVGAVDHGYAQQDCKIQGSFGHATPCDNLGGLVVALPYVAPAALGLNPASTIVVSSDARSSRRRCSMSCSSSARRRIRSRRWTLWATLTDATASSWTARASRLGWHCPSLSSDRVETEERGIGFVLHLSSEEVLIEIGSVYSESAEILTRTNAKSLAMMRRLRARVALCSGRMKGAGMRFVLSDPP